MSFWRPIFINKNIPLYQSIAESIRDAVEKGELSPGDRLAPHRQMADDLGVTIGTVARGYNLAASWGIVSGIVGRGTIIRSPENGYAHIPLNLKDTYINLGILNPAPTTHDQLRKKAFEETLNLVGRRWRKHFFAGLPPEFGNMPYRIAGAQWLRRRGIEADADEVLLTAGGQEALHLLLTTFTDPGDAILVEECTHLSLKYLGAALNLKMLGVPLDKEGILPDALDTVARHTKARILFLTPSLHTPTTAMMGVKRRENIVDIARQNNLFIIEYDPFAEFTIKAPPSLVMLAPERTAYVTTLSYYGSVEIRVGYLKTLKKRIPELKTAKRALAVSGSMISAEIATHWIYTGILEALADRQRSEIEVRAGHVKNVFYGLSYQYTPNAPFLWLKLPSPWRASDFAAAAKDRNVMILESERFVMGRTAAPHAVRIAITSEQDRNRFVDGLRVLADLVKKPSKTDPLG